MLRPRSDQLEEALSAKPVKHAIDRLEVTNDSESLVVDAGRLLVATLAARLGLEGLVDASVRLVGRVGGARPGRKVLTVVHAMVAGAACSDDAGRLRAGATGAVLGHRVRAPSTLGTFGAPSASATSASSKRWWVE